MKKNIQVILKQSKTNLGQAGNIINVTSGYAFNYLIPNKIADIASKGTLKHAHMLLNIQSKKLENIKIQAQKLQKQLEQIAKISIKKKIGENQQIFGSINDKEIITTISKSTGIELDKKHIKIPEIKTVGIYSIKIQILDNIQSNLKLQVLPVNI